MAWHQPFRVDKFSVWESLAVWLEISYPYYACQCW